MFSFSAFHTVERAQELSGHAKSMQRRTPYHCYNILIDGRVREGDREISLSILQQSHTRGPSDVLWCIASILQTRVLPNLILIRPCSIICCIDENAQRDIRAQLCAHGAWLFDAQIDIIPSDTKSTPNRECVPVGLLYIYGYLIWIRDSDIS